MNTQPVQICDDALAFPLRFWIFIIMLYPFCPWATNIRHQSISIRQNDVTLCASSYHTLYTCRSVIWLQHSAHDRYKTVVQYIAIVSNACVMASGALDWSLGLCCIVLRSMQIRSQEFIPICPHGHTLIKDILSRTNTPSQRKLWY